MTYNVGCASFQGLQAALVAILKNTRLPFPSGRPGKSTRPPSGFAHPRHCLQFLIHGLFDYGEGVGHFVDGLQLSDPRVCRFQPRGEHHHSSFPDLCGILAREHHDQLQRLLKSATVG